MALSLPWRLPTHNSLIALWLSAPSFYPVGFSGHRLKWGKPESAKFMSLDAALKELETESVDKYLSFLTPQ